MNTSQNSTANIVDVTNWGVHFTQKTPKLNYINYNRRTSSLSISNYHNKVLDPETFNSAKERLDYHLSQHKSMHLHISLTKLNASSVKGLLNLFNTLNHAWRKGREVSVSWMTPEEEDEIFDLAYDFSELYDFEVDVIMC